jgi:glycosyltransferase A (GT-A) superfamily protein (DUF2064 family)
MLYESFLKDMLNLARSAPNVSRLVYYWPPDQADYFRRMAPDFGLIPQQGVSLGERLDHSLTYCLTSGFGQAVITNSGSPTLPVPYLVRAFELLDRADVVLGPCDAGGYYLIGLTRPQPRLLLGVQMSTPTVAAETLARARAEGLRTALLPQWYDIDTAADLDRLAADLDRLPPSAAPHTRAYLRRMKKTRQ